MNTTTEEIPPFVGAMPSWARAEDSDLDIGISQEGHPVANWVRSLEKGDGLEVDINRFDSMDPKTGIVTEGKAEFVVWFGNNDAVHFTNAATARNQLEKLLSLLDLNAAEIEEAGL